MFIAPFSEEDLPNYQSLLTTLCNGYVSLFSFYHGVSQLWSHASYGDNVLE